MAAMLLVGAQQVRLRSRLAARLSRLIGNRRIEPGAAWHAMQPIQRALAGLAPMQVLALPRGITGVGAKTRNPSACSRAAQGGRFDRAAPGLPDERLIASEAVRQAAALVRS